MIAIYFRDLGSEFITNALTRQSFDDNESYRDMAKIGYYHRLATLSVSSDNWYLYIIYTELGSILITLFGVFLILFESSTRFAWHSLPRLRQSHLSEFKSSSLSAFLNTHYSLSQPSSSSSFSFLSLMTHFLCHLMTMHIFICMDMASNGTIIAHWYYVLLRLFIDDIIFYMIYLYLLW